MKIYIKEIKNDSIQKETQDSYFGGGEIYKYEGSPIDIIVKFNDNSQIQLKNVTKISAWLNSIEDNYCKIFINEKKLITKDILLLKNNTNI